MRTHNMGRKRVSVAIVSLLEDPKNYSEEFNCARATEWSKAMTEEISVLEANDAWELVAKPEHDKPLHSKWMVKTKNHADCTLKRFKARLVACGNERELCSRCREKYNVPARYGDVPNTYVRDEKESDLETLLHVPQVMTVDTNTLADLGLANESEVTLRLCKSLHVPKQAGHLWSLNIRKTLSKLGLVQSYTDCSMYKRGNGSDPTVGGVYVDDLPVTGTSVTNVDKFFEDANVVDLGHVSKFLGTGVVYDELHGYM
ncbi:putative pol polyprotein [Phytophthora cinnamomi]|uniref:putative pol polyprotein n=1 Tax=Phytophthora cinnamomi TaxID=4785 RepID=UPI00355951E7|nr:putative pol polyprotein [Phytophthora cinnamomi]